MQHENPNMLMIDEGEEDDLLEDYEHYLQNQPNNYHNPKYQKGKLFTEYNQWNEKQNTILND